MATFGTFVSGQVLTAAELNSAGAWQDYTPTWTQSAAITKTVNWARYTQLNKLVIVNLKMTSTGAGTANNKILVGLPVNASSNNYLMGSFTYHDTSEVQDQIIFAQAIYESTSTVGFFHSLPSVGTASNDLRTQVTGTADANVGIRFGQNYTTSAGGSVTGLTVGSGDAIYCQFVYEAA